MRDTVSRRYNQMSEQLAPPSAPPQPRPSPAHPRHLRLLLRPRGLSQTGSPGLGAGPPYPPALALCLRHEKQCGPRPRGGGDTRGAGHPGKPRPAREAISVRCVWPLGLGAALGLDGWSTWRAAEPRGSFWFRVLTFELLCLGSGLRSEFKCPFPTRKGRDGKEETGTPRPRGLEPPHKPVSPEFQGRPWKNPNCSSHTVSRRCLAAA